MIGRYPPTLSCLKGANTPVSAVLRVAKNTLCLGGGTRIKSEAVSVSWLNASSQAFKSHKVSLDSRKAKECGATCCSTTADST